MKTTKIETKTFYHVELDAADMGIAIDAYLRALDEDSVAVIGIDHDAMFPGFLCDSDDPERMEALCRHWIKYGTAETSSWLAKFNGFDGVQFCGVYRDRSDAVAFTFYNEGCDL